ncbi:hypothetical protein DFH09DRAFT_1084463 [Mycena vulgaris]|nr:hypothetical protein DFH09DRAFT_1084463 [Mycena vulgaris]
MTSRRSSTRRLIKKEEKETTRIDTGPPLCTTPARLVQRAHAFATSPLARRATRIPATSRPTERTAALLASPPFHSTLRIPRLPPTSAPRGRAVRRPRELDAAPALPPHLVPDMDSSLRRCTRPDRARVPPTAVSLREYENSTTYPRTLHIAAPAPPPRGHSMRSRASSRPNTARKDEEGPCSQPTDSQRTHRGLAPQQRQSAGAAAATLRAQPRPQWRGVCARVQNGGVLTSLGSSRAAFWRRHRICARSRTLLVRASADAARALAQHLNSLISGWMLRRGGSFDPFKHCQATISIPQPEIIIDPTQLTEQLVSGILTLEAHFSIKYDNFFNDLGPYRDETLIREQLVSQSVKSIVRPYVREDSRIFDGKDGLRDGLNRCNRVAQPYDGPSTRSEEEEDEYERGRREQAA